MDFAMLVARLRLLLGAVLLLTMFAVAPPASAQQRNPDGSVNPTASSVKEKSTPAGAQAYPGARHHPGYEIVHHRAARRSGNPVVGLTYKILPEMTFYTGYSEANRAPTPLEFIDDTLGFNPEWVVDRIAPRPILFITTDDDRLVPPQESEAMYARAGEPKKLVVLKGFGHYEIYGTPSAR
jgi:fermentation-respiration switch protein FrsA (DUF1100 family)